MTVASAPSESFRSKVRSAVMWRSGSQIAGQMIAWVSTFMVLRILSPSDYGLYAMAGAVLSLLGLLNGYGLANALVQREKVSRFELRQLFGMLLVVNAALAAVQFAAAPLVAEYYGQAKVADILRVLAVVFLTNPFLALGYAVLARAMDFRKQAQVNLASATLGAIVALAGALAGLGVWTLVIAPVTMFTARGLGMALVARAFMWPSFDFRGTAAMAAFGGTVALSSVFYFVQTQSDVIIAGRAFDAHTVGLYTTALFLAQIFVNKVLPPLNEVAFTAYARMQHDREAFAAGFLLSVRTILLLSIPFCVGLAVAAQPIVQVMLGANWLDIVPLLQILGLAIPFMTLHVLFAPATNAVGRPGIATVNSVIGALVMPAAFLIGVQWGVRGMTFAWLAAYPLITLVAALTSLRLIGVSLRDLATAILPLVLAAAAMAIIVSLIDDATTALPALARLVLLAGSGAAIYIGWIAVFSRHRLDELVALIRNR